ncbi:hypothetical protein M1513_01045 [Patescibacteria group bacterium]|nr:hypothetical protein [Patescibacteria group bacterium]MCL5733393.1 hypothetical protein [Patescibacteria group bacterium]
MNNYQKIYIFMAVVVVLVLVGFIVVFIQLNSLGEKINYLSGETASFSALQNSNQSPENSSASSVASTSANLSGNQASINEPAPLSFASSSAPVNGIDIPASIVFYATSTLSAQSQDRVMITIEGVSRSGSQLAVYFKVFNNTQNNTAVDPSAVIQLFDPSGGSFAAQSTNGNFSLISPQSSLDGSLIFLIDPSQNAAILQVGSSDNPIFYKFDFLNKNYQETVVG